MRHHWALFAAACLCLSAATPVLADGQSGPPAPQPAASASSTNGADTSQTGSNANAGTNGSTANTTGNTSGSNGLGVSMATGDNNPFADVPTDSFAYKAIVQLHDLGYLKGYPDGLFHGQRDLTRYEMAVMVDRVVSEMEYQLQDPNGAVRMNAQAIADARALLDEYGSDIKDLQQKEASLETRMTTAETTLDRMQIHAFAYVRAPGTYTETVSAFQPNGTPLKPGTVVKDDAQSYVVGTNGRGTGIEDFRLIFSGNLDKQTSYAVRVENKDYFGQANTYGIDTTTATPSVTLYNKGGLFSLNYAYLKYQFDHSPVYVEAGKYTLRSDPLGLAYDNDYYNGGLLGFKSPKVYGWFGFGQTGGPDLGSTSPFAYVPGPVNAASVPNTQFIMLAHAGITPSTKALVTGSWVELQGYSNNFWDNAQQKYIPLHANLSVGAIGASYQFVPVVTAQVQGLMRFGNDPTTGVGWTDNDAFWGQLLLGHPAPLANQNFAELGWIGTGAHSVLNTETFLNGTPWYTNYYTGQANDRKMAYIGLHHWLNQYMRIGVNYQYWGLNTPIPLFSGTGIPAGSYLMNNDNRALFLNSFMQF
ncbi:MAG TPA: S-layer homology domain-containing protein [Candidatus Acidoferrales bacterium]|nr:S-layer homology domain-containing protein [Candidatus Acidoferrales bacterium]